MPLEWGWARIWTTHWFEIDTFGIHSPGSLNIESSQNCEIICWLRGLIHYIKLDPGKWMFQIYSSVNLDYSFLFMDGFIDQVSCILTFFCQKKKKKKKKLNGGGFPQIVRLSIGLHWLRSDLVWVHFDNRTRFYCRICWGKQSSKHRVRSNVADLFFEKMNLGRLDIIWRTHLNVLGLDIYRIRST